MAEESLSPPQLSVFEWMVLMTLCGIICGFGVVAYWHHVPDELPVTIEKGTKRT